MKKQSPSGSNHQPEHIAHDQIAIFAKQLWEAAGRPSGSDIHFWLQAEADLVKTRQRDIAHSQVVRADPTSST